MPLLVLGEELVALAQPLLMESPTLAAVAAAADRKGQLVLEGREVEVLVAQVVPVPQEVQTQVAAGVVEDICLALALDMLVAMAAPALSSFAIYQHLMLPHPLRVHPQSQCQVDTASTLGQVTAQSPFEETYGAFCKT